MRSFKSCSGRRRVNERVRTISGVPYVYVTRGPLVESVHHVAACVVDASGRVVRSLGDIDAPVYLRSAAKPFIAAEIVACGAADRFALDARELAVITGSHNGEPPHVAAVRDVLAKIGLDVRALKCGTHAPSYEPAAAALAATGGAPSALHNNCSGKHAGILAMCVHLGLDHTTYLAPGHPVQQRILQTCGRLVDDDPARMPLAVDGCGIPVFATSLRGAARAFARLATFAAVTPGDAGALQRVRDAMVAEPYYVAGSERFDTALGETTHGRIVGKAGAEGVHGSALLREGFGFVLKVTDGNRRAAAPAAVALLRELGALDEAEVGLLDAFAAPAVRNAAGRIVGAIEAGVRDTIPFARSS